MAVLRNHSITPTRPPADIRDASRPARIQHAPRGARRFDGGLVVSKTARRGRPGRQVTQRPFEPERSRLGEGPATRSVRPGSNICGAQARTQDAGVQVPAIRPALSRDPCRDLQRIRFSAASDQPSDAETIPHTGKPRLESGGCMSAVARPTPDSTATG